MEATHFSLYSLDLIGVLQCTSEDLLEFDFHVFEVGPEGGLFRVYGMYDGL
jgi:hypothetical protein